MSMPASILPIMSDNDVSRDDPTLPRPRLVRSIMWKLWRRVAATAHCMAPYVLKGGEATASFDGLSSHLLPELFWHGHGHPIKGAFNMSDIVRTFSSIDTIRTS